MLMTVSRLRAMTGDAFRFRRYQGLGGSDVFSGIQSSDLVLDGGEE
jgi:hypothetical protein